MNFFILTSALVCAVLAFLAWYNWKLKGKLAIAEFDRDKALMEAQALEAEFKVIEGIPAQYMGKVDLTRWRAVIANAIANTDNPSQRIAWGKEFNEHFRRQEARLELDVGTPPSGSIIERAMDAETPTMVPTGALIQEGDGPPLRRQTKKDKK